MVAEVGYVPTKLRSPSRAHAIGENPSGSLCAAHPVEAPPRRQFRRAERVTAELLRRAEEVPLGTYFWESKPSTAEFTRISRTRRKVRPGSAFIDDMIDDELAEITDFDFPEGTGTRERHDTTRAPTQEV